jgi:hypothetical protein
MSNWPVYEIRDKRPRSGLQGDFRCMIDTLLWRGAPVDYAGPDLDAFDHVVLISPVWLRSLAAPMRTFLKQHGHQIKGYSAICVMSGYGGSGALNEMAEVMNSRPRFALLLKQNAVYAGGCEDTLYQLKEQLDPAG